MTNQELLIRHITNVSDRMYQSMRVYLKEQDLHGKEAWQIYYNAMLEIVIQYFISARPDDSPEQIKELILKESEFYRDMIKKVDYSFNHPLQKKYD